MKFLLRILRAPLANSATLTSAAYGVNIFAAVVFLDFALGMDFFGGRLVPLVRPVLMLAVASYAAVWGYCIGHLVEAGQILYGPNERPKGTRATVVALTTTSFSDRNLLVRHNL
jgi:hypothetical protein